MLKLIINSLLVQMMLKKLTPLQESNMSESQYVIKEVTCGKAASSSGTEEV